MDFTHCRLIPFRFCHPVNQLLYQLPQGFQPDQQLRRDGLATPALTIDFRVAEMRGNDLFRHESSFKLSNFQTFKLSNL